MIELMQLASEAARNLFGAGGGSLHPSTAASTVGALAFTFAHWDALAAGQHVYLHGGDDTLKEEAYKDSFAESLGWSEQEFEQFWNDPNYEFTAEGASRFDETWDAWEWMTRRGR